MTLEFELTEQDFIDFNLYHFENSKTIKNAHQKSRFGAAVLFLALPFVLKNVTTIPFLYWMIIFSIMAVLWIIFFPPMMKKFYKKSVLKMIREKDNTFLGKKTITLSDSGIIVFGKSGESTSAYSSIISVEKGKNAIYLYNSSVSAILVPNSAFTDKETKKDFLQKLDFYIKKSTYNTNNEPLENTDKKRKSVYDYMDKL